MHTNYVPDLFNSPDVDVPLPSHAALVLTCPPAGTSGPAAEIRKRGNIPLDVAGRFLAELDSHDLNQSWSSALKLPKNKVTCMARDMVNHLFDDNDCVTSDMMAEAAACFLLSLRHHHLSPHQAYKGCRITWAEGHDQVEYLTT